MKRCTKSYILTYPRFLKREPWQTGSLCKRHVTLCGGGFFFLAFEDLGKIFDNLFPVSTFFLSFFSSGDTGQTAVVGSCFPFIRSGQNHRARHSEREKKTRQTEEEVGRQHQGLAWSSAGPRERWRTGKNGENCGAQTTLAVKELMMMMMKWRLDRAH